MCSCPHAVLMMQCLANTQPMRHRWMLKPQVPAAHVPSMGDLEQVPSPQGWLVASFDVVNLHMEDLSSLCLILKCILLNKCIHYFLKVFYKLN